MKYGTVIRLLTMACVAVIPLAGCSPDMEEREKTVLPVPIRIVAEMDRGTSTFRATKTAVRASGEWKENEIGAEEYEKTIHHVLLFAYKNMGTSPEKVVFYYP